MRKHFKLAALAGISVFALIPSAHAGVIYTTSFESPVFTPGVLQGQDGWSSDNGAIVESGIATDGVQALGIIGNATGPRAVRSTAVDTTVDNVVLTSADFAFSDFTSGWSFFGLGQSFNTLGGFTVESDGSLQFMTAGLPVTTTSLLSANSFANLAVVYDFTAGTFSVFLNGSAVGANLPFFDASNTQFEGAVYSNSAANGGVLFTDNYTVAAQASVAPAPEPATVFLTLIAVLAVAIRARRLHQRAA